jgi:hypothetical protein
MCKSINPANLLDRLFLKFDHHARARGGLRVSTVHGSGDTRGDENQGGWIDIATERAAVVRQKKLSPETTSQQSADFSVEIPGNTDHSKSQAQPKAKIRMQLRLFPRLR